MIHVTHMCSLIVDSTTTWFLGTHELVSRVTRAWPVAYREERPRPHVLSTIFFYCLFQSACGTCHTKVHSSFIRGFPKIVSKSIRKVFPGDVNNRGGI